MEHGAGSPKEVNLINGISGNGSVERASQVHGHRHHAAPVGQGSAPAPAASTATAISSAGRMTSDLVQAFRNGGDLAIAPQGESSAMAPAMHGAMAHSRAS